MSVVRSTVGDVQVIPCASGLPGRRPTRKATMTLSFAPSPVRLDFGGVRAGRLPGLAAVQLNDALWRITRPDGEVLGYIERFAVREGERFRAKRFLPRQRRFLVDGEFWSMDDAIECFRAA